jgi:hypothetical protein
MEIYKRRIEGRRFRFEVTRAWGNGEKYIATPLQWSVIEPRLRSFLAAEGSWSRDTEIIPNGEFCVPIESQEGYRALSRLLAVLEMPEGPQGPLVASTRKRSMLSRFVSAWFNERLYDRLPFRSIADLGLSWLSVLPRAEEPGLEGSAILSCTEEVMALCQSALERIDLVPPLGRRMGECWWRLTGSKDNAALIALWWKPLEEKPKGVGPIISTVRMRQSMLQTAPVTVQIRNLDLLASLIRSIVSDDHALSDREKQLLSDALRVWHATLERRTGSSRRLGNTDTQLNGARSAVIE